MIAANLKYSCASHVFSGSLASCAEWPRLVTPSSRGSSSAKSPFSWPTQQPVCARSPQSAGRRIDASILRTPRGLAGGFLANIRELISGPPIGLLGDNDGEEADKQNTASEAEGESGAFYWYSQ